MKRGIITNDRHCGHFAGLTPPDWWWNNKSRRKNIKAVAKLQRTLWNWYEKEMQGLDDLDFCIGIGDDIDGKGYRSGGNEQIVSDMLEQAQMAAETYKVIPTDNIYLAYGTPYHVSNNGDDAEKIVAQELDAELHGHLYLQVEDVLLDCKHKVGSSSVPHGRHTAIARENLWSILWSERGEPRGENYTAIFRGHVHYYNFCGGFDWVGITCPALQGPGSVYGVRQCSGVVDFGYIYVEIDGENFSWEPRILRVITEQEPLKL